MNEHDAPAYHKPVVAEVRGAEAPVHQPDAAPAVSSETASANINGTVIYPASETMGGKVPAEIVVEAQQGNPSSIIPDMAAQETLTDMIGAYRRQARRMEAGFRGMYKERNSDHPADLDEREFVARDMHSDRAQARDFLKQVKHLMKEQGLLSAQQEAAFDEAMLPPHQRRPQNER